MVIGLVGQVRRVTKGRVGCAKAGTSGANARLVFMVLIFFVLMARSDFHFIRAKSYGRGWDIYGPTPT